MEEQDNDFQLNHKCANCGHDLDDHSGEGFYKCEYDDCDCTAFVEE